MSEYTFKLPDLGEGTVESEISEWNIAVGDDVKEDDIVATMMTDKAAVELMSPVSGKVVSLAGEPGDMIAVGAALVVFERETALDNAEPAVASTEPDRQENALPIEVTAVEQPRATPEANSKIITSPAIRRRAREAGIDLSTVPGTGPGGRIVRGDLDKFMQWPQMDRRINKPPPAKVTEVSVIGLRRIIAERMTEANREVPHFSYVEEIDISELDKLRKRLNARLEASDRLTVLPFISLALIRALAEFPQCNTTYDKNRNVLLRHEAVHLGVATQTTDGLKVPVVKNAHLLTLTELAAQIRRVTELARDNRIARGELSGSTITVTSLGKLGGIVSTPVINLPEVAIVGVNRAIERPMVVDGQISIRLMMNLSSSFDHRFVDGYDAAAMVQRIREMLEYPASIFIG